MLNQSNGTAIFVVADDKKKESSYLEWICLPLENFQTDCQDNSGKSKRVLSSVEKEDLLFMPGLEVHGDGHDHIFEGDFQNYGNCLAQKATWEHFLRDQSQACFLAAKIPTNDDLSEQQDDVSIWALYGLKTAHGNIFYESFGRSQLLRSQSWVVP